MCLPTCEVCTGEAAILASHCNRPYTKLLLHHQQALQSELLASLKRTERDMRHVRPPGGCKKAAGRTYCCEPDHLQLHGGCQLLRVWCCLFRLVDETPLRRPAGILSQQDVQQMDSCCTGHWPNQVPHPCKGCSAAHQLCLGQRSDSILQALLHALLFRPIRLGLQSLQD